MSHRMSYLCAGSTVVHPRRCAPRPRFEEEPPQPAMATHILAMSVDPLMASKSRFFASWCFGARTNLMEWVPNEPISGPLHNKGWSSERVYGQSRDRGLVQGSEPFFLKFWLHNKQMSSSLDTFHVSRTYEIFIGWKIEGEYYVNFIFYLQKQYRFNS